MATGIRKAGTDSLPRLLSARQLAAYLDVPVSTIYLWRSRGEGPPGFRLGKQIRYREDDVLHWLEQKKGAVQQAALRDRRRLAESMGSGP